MTWTIREASVPDESLRGELGQIAAPSCVGGESPIQEHKASFRHNRVDPDPRCVVYSDRAPSLFPRRFQGAGGDPITPWVKGMFPIQPPRSGSGGNPKDSQPVLSRGGQRREKGRSHGWSGVARLLPSRGTCDHPNWSPGRCRRAWETKSQVGIQRNPSTSCISYRPGLFFMASRAHRAALRAPRAKVSRLEARWISSRRSPGAARRTV